MVNLSNEDSRSKKSWLFVELRLKPSLMSEFIEDDSMSIDECVEEILNRMSLERVVSPVLNRRYGNGYTLSDIREAIYRLANGDCGSLEEAFRG